MSNSLSRFSTRRRRWMETKTAAVPVVQVDRKSSSKAELLSSEEVYRRVVGECLERSKRVQSERTALLLGELKSALHLRCPIPPLWNIIAQYVPYDIHPTLRVCPPRYTPGATMYGGVWLAPDGDDEAGPSRREDAKKIFSLLKSSTPSVQTTGTISLSGCGRHRAFIFSGSILGLFHRSEGALTNVPVPFTLLSYLGWDAASRLFHVRGWSWQMNRPGQLVRGWMCPERRMLVNITETSHHGVPVPRHEQTGNLFAFGLWLCSFVVVAAFLIKGFLYGR
jgi:hypothetical protein